MSPLKRRNYPEFSSYFNELWKILGNGNGDDTSTVDGPDLEIQILSMELNPVMRIHRQPETDS